MRVVDTPLSRLCKEVDFRFKSVVLLKKREEKKGEKKDCSFAKTFGEKDCSF